MQLYNVYLVGGRGAIDVSAYSVSLSTTSTSSLKQCADCPQFTETMFTGFINPYAQSLPPSPGTSPFIRTTIMTHIIEEHLSTYYPYGYFISSSCLCCICMLCVTSWSYCDFEFPHGINKVYTYQSIYLLWPIVGHHTTGTSPSALSASFGRG